MLFFEKKVSETPLEMLERLRIEKPEFVNSKLSYAGRLDPMAEGQMLVLVDEENKDYKKYLEFDKEYVATFLVGFKTDTGDILGLITDSDDKLIIDGNKMSAGGDGNKMSAGGEIITVDEKNILKQVEHLTKITEQTYPWFSSKTVDGLKLFDHFKKGNLEIERPIRKIKIKEAEFMSLNNLDANEVFNYIFDSIQKVNGDFRQSEIYQNWKEVFDNISSQTKSLSKIKTELPSKLPAKIQTFQIRFLVSSGTYIRALTENFDFPTTLLKLRRTKIKI